MRKPASTELSVFIMTPSGGNPTYVEVYEQAIKPALKRFEMVGRPWFEDVRIGRITAHIKKGIKDAEFCICDLSGSNPNVLYEAALASSMGKQLIMITRGKYEDVPFDVRHHRVFRYEPSKKGYAELERILSKAIRAVREEEVLDVTLIRRLLVPSSLENTSDPFVIAAHPFPRRLQLGEQAGWRRPLKTYSDHVGIQGLIQSFGLMFGFEERPFLVNPLDFHPDTLEEPMHLYAIGSAKSNRWTERIMAEYFERHGRHAPTWEFKPNSESASWDDVEAMICMDGSIWKPYRYRDEDLVKRTKEPTIEELDYGLVLRGPNPYDQSCMFMVLAGRSFLGTEAACLSVTEPDCARKLSNELAKVGLDLDQHRHAFSAIVSKEISAGQKNVDSIRIEEVVSYRQNSESLHRT